MPSDRTTWEDPAATATTSLDLVPAGSGQQVWLSRSLKAGALASCLLLGARDAVITADLKGPPAVPPTHTATSLGSEPVAVAEVAPPGRTPLGRRLRALRARLVASGEPLLGWDEIEQEARERRGGVDQHEG